MELNVFFTHALNAKQLPVSILREPGFLSFCHRPPLEFHGEVFLGSLLLENFYFGVRHSPGIVIEEIFPHRMTDRMCYALKSELNVLRLGKPIELSTLLSLWTSLYILSIFCRQCQSTTCFFSSK